MQIINATLIVQMVHFGIAYLIIRYLFFKPAVDQLKAEKDLQTSLFLTIQGYQAAITRKEQEIAADWQHARAVFAERTPLLKKPVFADVHARSQVVLPVLEKETVMQAAQQVTAHLVKELMHVR